MRMKEAMEQEKRRMNVVTMGVPETDEDHDKEEVGNVINGLIEEVRIGWEMMGRIGKRGDKGRPIKVKFTEINDKRRVLSRAKNLKNKVGMETIYIVPDLTQDQQRDDKVRRDEVKRLKDAGAQNVRISKGMVVYDK